MALNSIGGVRKGKDMNTGEKQGNNDTNRNKKQ